MKEHSAFTLLPYDLSDTPSRGEKRVDVESVSDLARAGSYDRTLPPEMRATLASIRFDEFDPLGVSSPKRWEYLMSLVIYRLSGTLPLRQEVLRGRQILAALPVALRKREVLERIAFSLLPYLLVGFKTHLEDRFQEDSNRIREVVRFIVHLSESSHPAVRSFLCAHRGVSTTERHVLIENVQSQRAEVTLNLMLGILANSPWAESGAVRWCQQDATEWACSNMFPEMFLRYLRAGAVPELLVLLRNHFSQVEEVMAAASDCRIKAGLSGLDALVGEVHSSLVARYGATWCSNDFAQSCYDGDEVVGIALTYALPNLLRQMPFYANCSLKQECLEQKEAYIVANGGRENMLVRRAIERFYAIQLMHPTAKALYETSLYCAWGEIAARQGEVVIGIDRDHNEFQYRAWKLGYDRVSGATSEAVPLLYARRAPEQRLGEGLKYRSFRQFWR